MISHALNNLKSTKAIPPGIPLKPILHNPSFANPPPSILKKNWILMQKLVSVSFVDFLFGLQKERKRGTTKLFPSLSFSHQNGYSTISMRVKRSAWDLWFSFCWPPHEISSYHGGKNHTSLKVILIKNVMDICIIYCGNKRCVFWQQTYRHLGWRTWVPFQRAGTSLYLGLVLGYIENSRLVLTS